VTLTETQRKAAINSPFQSGSNARDLEDWLEAQPQRFLLLGITADSYDSVIWVTSQFSGHLNGWWLNRKVQAAIPSTYDQLVAELRKTTFLPNIQDDAINALLNLTQSNTMSYAVFVKQFNDFLRRSRQNLTAVVHCVRFINGQANLSLKTQDKSHRSQKGYTITLVELQNFLNDVVTDSPELGSMRSSASPFAQPTRKRNFDDPLVGASKIWKRNGGGRGRGRGRGGNGGGRGQTSSNTSRVDFNTLANAPGPMRRQRLNGLSPAERVELNRQLKDAVEAGVIRPSYSEFGSPILFVRKADGSLRLCIDYRGLNEVTRKDAYPLPRVDDTLDELKDANFYTHLDLASGFWQVRVRDKDIHKTAFQTHEGLMEWVAMPFGLCNNAPATFQRMMNDILRNFLHKFVTVYLDDVCIYSQIVEDHLEHLRLVLQRFKEEGLKLSLKKCFFGLQEMEYLGYTVSVGKISVSTKKVEAVTDWPLPKTQKEVRSFVQFCNFYARFIHHFSDLTAPLTDLLRKSKPQKVTLTPACLEALETLKLRLISAPCMILPEVGSFFYVDNRTGNSETDSLDLLHWRSKLGCTVTD
jgi:hypothetical protein